MRRFAFFIMFLCNASGFCFGQKNPEPFISDVLIKYPNIRDVAIYGNEVYCTMQSYQEEFSVIIYTKKENNKWQSPQVVNFSGQYNDLEPFITADGSRLYFASNRPTDPAAAQTKDFDIWFVERKTTSDPWQKPVNLGSPVNTKYNEFYPSLSKNNNIYFTSDRPDSKGKDDIFTSSFLNGTYNEPITLSDSINTVGYEFNAFISPDESFLIYTAYNRKGGSGSGDLYISIKDKAGNWGDSKNLGSIINSDKMDYCPYVDMKSKTLYFTSRKNNVQTKFSEPQSIDQLLTEFTKYENGASRLYMVNIKTWIN